MMDQSLFRDFAGIILGWMLGLISALAARRYDERRATRDVRLALLERIRTRLSAILSGVERRTGYYFTQKTADRILEDLRHDVFALLDEDLIGAIEDGETDIRSIAFHGGDESRRAAEPHLQRMLKRVYDLTRALEPKQAWWRHVFTRWRLRDPFKVHVK